MCLHDRSTLQRTFAIHVHRVFPGWSFNLFYSIYCLGYRNYPFLLGTLICPASVILSRQPKPQHAPVRPFKHLTSSLKRFVFRSEAGWALGSVKAKFNLKCAANSINDCHELRVKNWELITLRSYIVGFRFRFDFRLKTVCPTARWSIPVCCLFVFSIFFFLY